MRAGCRRHTSSRKGCKGWGVQKMFRRVHHCSQLLWVGREKNNAKWWKSWRDTRAGLTHNYLLNSCKWSTSNNMVQPDTYYARLIYPQINTCNFCEVHFPIYTSKYHCFWSSTAKWPFVLLSWCTKLGKPNWQQDVFGIEKYVGLAYDLCPQHSGYGCDIVSCVVAWCGV